MKYRVYYTVSTTVWIEVDDLPSVKVGEIPSGMEELIRSEAELCFGDFDHLEIDHWEKLEPESTTPQTRQTK
jgi:hypothetical protein